jgi:hypothetical protein
MVQKLPPGRPGTKRQLKNQKGTKQPDPDPRGCGRNLDNTIAASKKGIPFH